jgi:hypothetical protein
MVNEARRMEGFYPEFYKDCKAYINEWVRSRAKTFMLRGTRKPVNSYTIINSHVDSGRSPMDMPRELHSMLNRIFKAEFHWNVRDGVSTTGKDTETMYGPQYLFFPIGAYKYVWSPYINDLYSHLESEGMLGDDYFDYETCRDEWYDTYGNEGNKNYGHWEYDDEEVEYPEDVEEDLGDDFDRLSLVWIPDMDYESYAQEKRQEYEDTWEDRIEDVVRKSRYTDRNLKSAVESHHEVLFNCKSYYLIDQKYTDWLERAFKMAHGDPRQMKLFDLEDWKE